MPGLNGIDVIAKAKEISPMIEAIVLTGKGSTDTAISALRLGAFEYLQKPCKLVDLKTLLQRVAIRRELNNQIYRAETAVGSRRRPAAMIGDHRNMQRVKALIEKVAPTQSTVMVSWRNRDRQRTGGPGRPSIKATAQTNHLSQSTAGHCRKI